jgi:hypothetical protein
MDNKGTPDVPAEVITDKDRAAGEEMLQVGHRTAIGDDEPRPIISDPAPPPEEPEAEETEAEGAEVEGTE